MLREKNLSQVMVAHALKLSVTSRKSKNLNNNLRFSATLPLVRYALGTVSHTPCSLNPAPLNELFPLPGIFNNHPSSQHTPKPGLYSDLRPSLASWFRSLDLLFTHTCKHPSCH